MRILLLGEFSRLHNTLKEGLQALGHEVILVNNGDGFKNYPADISIRSQFFKSFPGSLIRRIWYRLFKRDLVIYEHGLRFWNHLSDLKDFDVVQLINEKPIQTSPAWEYQLIEKIFRQNPNCYLLSCGVDTMNLAHMLAKKERYSILDPYFENPKTTETEYLFMWEYQTQIHNKIHDLIMCQCKGIIASDLDYVAPLRKHPKFLGLIPNPVNTDRNSYQLNPVTDKIIIFLGINSGNYHTKGIRFFEEALAIIKERWSAKTEIITTVDIPYGEYHTHFERAHILLDQVYAFDQGYNALEAMAKGKVVFTGAEKEFLDHYQLKEDEVAVNALPNVAYLVEKIEDLIQHPEKIEMLGKNASQFVHKHHHHITIAQRYIQAWTHEN
ncbi:MAG: putative glycosyl transferase WbsE [Bacteroidota bacterium]